MAISSLLFPSLVAPAFAHEEVSQVTSYTANQKVEVEKTAEALAGEYIAKAFESWNAKTRASQAKIDAQHAAEEAVVARNAYSASRDKAVAARADYEQKRKVSVNWVREIMRNPSTNMDPSLQALTMSAENAGDLARNIKQVESINDIKQKATMDADASLAVAVEAEAEAQRLLAEAEKAEENSTLMLEKAKKLEIESATLLQDAKRSLTEASSRINSQEIANKDEKTDKKNLPASQRILNDAVLQRWATEKKTLRENKDLLPQQDEVVKIDTTSIASRSFFRAQAPAELPMPLFTESGAPQIGASVLPDGSVLISRDAMKRVQKAIDYLGTPYEDLTCQALVSEVSGQKKTKDLNKLFSSAYQNKSVSDTLPGDIVFFADAHGISQAGVSIGGGLVVASSAAAKSVIVIEINDNALISTRPGIDYDKKTQQQAPTSNEEDAITWECGGIASSFGSVTGVSWVLPYGDREHNIDVKFGDKDNRFKDKVSPGFLLSVDKKDVVQAAFAGVARVKETEKRGKTVTLRYNENISVRYSGLSKTAVTDGTFVGVGDPIGISGKSGSFFEKNKKTAVFVEVLINDEPIDGEYMFFPPEEAGAEGYPNGLIPKEALCPINVGSHMLRCDAAQGFTALNAAFKAEFGRNITVTDSYRSLEAQKRLKKQKPVLAATPGRSNHGWGLALDLGGNINSFGTDEYKWMLENAPSFGWENPEWAQQNGSKPEAWHFEFFSAAQ